METTFLTVVMNLLIFRSWWNRREISRELCFISAKEKEKEKEKENENEKEKDNDCVGVLNSLYRTAFGSADFPSSLHKLCPPMAAFITCPLHPCSNGQDIEPAKKRQCLERDTEAPPSQAIVKHPREIVRP